MNQWLFFTAGGSIAHKMQSAERGTINSIMSWTVKTNPFCLIYVFISTVFLLSSDDKWHKFFGGSQITFNAPLTVTERK